MIRLDCEIASIDSFSVIFVMLLLQLHTTALTAHIYEYWGLLVNGLTMATYFKRHITTTTTLCFLIFIMLSHFEMFLL